MYPTSLVHVEIAVGLPVMLAHVCAGTDVRKAGAPVTFAQASEEALVRYPLSLVKVDTAVGIPALVMNPTSTAPSLVKVDTAVGIPALVMNPTSLVHAEMAVGLPVTEAQLWAGTAVRNAL